ncbi:MAG: hypothetical protein GY861_01710 [bacterium]|nr:hypothetical protein [bacterium]
MDKYLSARQVELKSTGRDEQWIRNVINNDPSILRLGELKVVETNEMRASGAEGNFLMGNADDSVRYEIGVTLGKLDESTIIRTIEYWDIERKRFPSLQHRAVIVTEEIPNGFFNVISFLNETVPITVLLVNAFMVESYFVLLFAKVFGISESSAYEEQGTSVHFDREYWEKQLSQILQSQ